MRRFDGADAAALAMAVGLIGLGALTLVWRDFASVWQPVPASWPGRPWTPIASGLVLVAAGGLMISPRTRIWGGGLAAAFIGLWVAVLHLPNALAKPLVWNGWQGVCESTVVAAGALIAAWETRGRAPLAVVYLMGACFVVFGISHFVYAKFTTAMVPAWLPDRPAFTYLTGAIHALTGLAILAGVRRRWAAAIEALMMTSFVLLVHIPRVAARPLDRMEETELFVALALASAAWLLATSKALRGKGG